MLKKLFKLFRLASLLDITFIPCGFRITYNGSSITFYKEDIFIHNLGMLWQNSDKVYLRGGTNKYATSPMHEDAYPLDSLPPEYISPHEIDYTLIKSKSKCKCGGKVSDSSSV